MSPPCESLEPWVLFQRNGMNNWMDVQALALPAALAHHGEKEAHCAPRSFLPLHTQAVLLREPRSFLTDSGSTELSEGVVGRNRRVHVVLPLPGSMGPLARPQA